MSQTDERVVVLEFDNSKFEKNTKQSIKSLEDLDASIEKAGSAKGLENLGRSANKIDLSGLEANVEKVSKRFSTLGIVGMTAIQNITNSVMNVGKTVLGQIISGGWKRALNIEQAKFQIEGLKGVWDQTSKGYKEGMKTIKDAVNNAVSGTAYGLDEAAKVGSQLMASGITNTNTLEEHLKSVSGLAAMTGGSFEDIGRIFTQVAGQGRVLGDQLNQVSARGINAAATMKNYLNNNKSIRDEVLKTAKASGKSANLVAGMIENVNKGMDLTEGNVRDLVSTGTVSFEVFSGAMHEAFAKHAKEANKTFTGSLANMKAALSRIGAEFATPSLEHLRDIFNSITPVIDAAHKSMMPFVDFVVKRMGQATKITTTFMKSLIIMKGGEFKGWASVEQVAKRLTKVLGGQDSKNIADTWGGIVSLFNIIKRVISSVLKMFGTGASSIGSFLLSITGLIGRVIMTIDEATQKTTVLGSVVNLLKTILSGVVNVLSSIFDLVGHLISGLDWRDNGVAKLSESMEKSVSVLEKVKNLIKNVFDGISDAISNGLNSVSKATAGGDTGGLLSLLQVGAITGAYFGLTRAITKILNTFNKIAKSAHSAVKVLDNVQKILVNYQHLIKAQMIRNIAISLGILAAALFLISQVDSDKVTTSLITLGAMFVEFIAAFTVFSKILAKNSFKDTAKLSILTTALIGFSIAVVILSAAVKNIAGLSWNELARGLTGIVVILYALSKFADSMTKMENGLFTTSVSLIALGIALNILVKAVSSLALMDVNSLIKGLTGLLGLLFALHWFMSNAENFDLSVKAASGILMLSICMNLLAIAVSKLAALNLTQMATALFGIGTLFLEIQMFTSAMSNVKNLYASSNALFMIAGSISIMAEGLKQLGTLSWEKITKGLVTFTATLLIADVALNKLSSLGSMGSGFALILLATALNIFVPALKKLGDLPVKTIGSALLYLAGVLLTFGAISKILSVCAMAMVKLAGALALLGAGLALLGTGVFLLATGLTMLAAGGEAIIASIPGLVTGLVQGIKQFIIEIATTIPNLVELGMQIIIALLKGIRDNIPLMVEIAADIIIKFLQALTEKLPAIIDAGFDFLGAFIEGIVKGLSEFSSVVKKGANFLSAETIKMLSDALLEMAAAVYILKHVNPAAAIKAVAALAIFANGLALVLAEFGALSKIPGVKDFMNGGAELLATIGHAIGLFVGSLVGGVGEGITSSLPKMASNLSAFMKNLQPFLDAAKNVDSNVGTTIKNIAAAILYLTGAKFLDSLAVFAGSSTFSDFGKQLNEFTSGFKQFAESVRDIDEGSLDKVKIVSQTIKALALAAAEIPNTGGLVSLFTGDNELKEFTKQFGDAADDIYEMTYNLSEVNKKDLEKIKNTAAAIKAMVEVADEIPNTGGLVSAFTGDNKLSDFGKELADFAEPLGQFAEGVSQVKSWKGVKNAADAMKSINEFANEIPNTGGLAADIMGDNTLGQFGSQMAAFAPSLLLFVNSVSGIKEENVGKVKSVIPIMRAMAEVAKEIPNVGGVAGFFAGNSMMIDEKFGDNIIKFAKAVNKTAKAFSGIKNTESISAAIPLIDAFKRLIGALPETGGIFDIFTGDEDLETWSSQLKSFGKGLKQFATEIADTTFNAAGLPELISALAKVAESSESFDGANFQKIIDALGGEEGSSSFGKAIKTFCNQIADIKTDNVSAVSKLINSLANLAKKTDGVSFDGLSQITKKLPKLGKNLGSFAKNLGEFNGDAALQAAKVVKTLSGITESFAQFTSTTRRGNSTSASFDTKTFDSFIKSLGKISKKVKEFAEEMQNVSVDGLGDKAKTIKKFVNTVVNSISNASKKLKSKGKTGLNAFLKGFTNVSGLNVNTGQLMTKILKSLGYPNFKKYNSAGESAAGKFVSGLKKKLNAAKDAGDELYKKVKDGANKSLYDTGKNVGSGFVSGIKDKTGAAASAGEALYDAAKQAIKNKSHQNSPAKDMIPVGQGIAEGFIVGVVGYKKEVYSAGEEVAVSMMRGVSDNVGSDFTDPVIRPVLDLSDVKKGMSYVGGMFGGTSIKPSLIPTIQNDQNGAKNEDVIEAINKMSTNIVKNSSSVKGDTYNIGDVTLDVKDLGDVLTLDQFVAVIKKAKAFS